MLTKMGVIRRKPATYEDLSAVPPHCVGEIISGELVVSPRPRSRHSRASSILGGKLSGPFDLGDGGPGGWWILDEPELHFGADVLVPDLAGWRREQMPQLPDVAYFTLPPDWNCEILSPATAMDDRVRKKAIYGREGVEHYWLIDPLGKTLETFTRARGAGTTPLFPWAQTGAFGGDQKIRVAPFEEVELDLAALWLPGGDED